LLDYRPEINYSNLQCRPHCCYKVTRRHIKESGQTNDRTRNTTLPQEHHPCDYDCGIFCFCICHYVTVVTIKVKQSRNMPVVAQRVPGGLGSQISWHSAGEDGEVVSLTHRPPSTPGMFLVLIFTRGWVDPRAMELSAGDTSLKNPVTTPGIDSGSVQLVAQRLNHYATSGPDDIEHILSNGLRIMNWRRLGMERSWVDIRHSHGIWP
jgi:hypothetical protein